VISLCSLNPFTNKISKKKVLELANIPLSGFAADPTSGYSNKLQYMNARYYQSMNVWTQFNHSIRENLGLSLNQTIISCVLGFTDCSMENDFLTFYDPIYGNCFKYNAEKSQITTIAGSQNGLQLELFSNDLNSNDSVFSINGGFMLYVTDESYQFNTFYLDGIAVELGKTTNIILRKQISSKQPKPYGECTRDLDKLESYQSECFKKTFQTYNNSYNLVNCHSMCFQVECLVLNFSQTFCYFKLFFFETKTNQFNFFN
jgi:hypothetical protein